MSPFRAITARWAQRKRQGDAFTVQDKPLFSPLPNATQMIIQKIIQILELRRSQLRVPLGRLLFAPLTERNRSTRTAV